MKLMFDLPPRDEAVIPKLAPGEKRMYCLPFNYLEGMIVNGYMVFTNQHI